jgi:uncharacterized protein (DUF1684 family)
MADGTNTQAEGPALLELADWRRQVADLYAGIRFEARGDPEAAWRHWLDVREELYRTHPQSPVPGPDRPAFRARHWPYDPRWRFEVVVELEAMEPRAPELAVAAEPVLGGLTIALPVSTGGDEALERIGSVTVPFAVGPRRLGLYWMSGYAGGLFLPFGDATNGRATYGAGRYLLDAAKSADLGPGAAPGSLILDFNFAFHPSCAFDPRWSCPLTPPENRLDMAVEAGERLV